MMTRGTVLPWSWLYRRLFHRVPEAPPDMRRLQEPARIGLLWSGERLGMGNVRCSGVKRRLPAVLRQVEQHGGVTITRRGVPVARIAPWMISATEGPRPATICAGWPRRSEPPAVTGRVSRLTRSFPPETKGGARLLVIDGFVTAACGLS